MQRRMARVRHAGRTHTGDVFSVRMYMFGLHLTGETSVDVLRSTRRHGGHVVGSKRQRGSLQVGGRMFDGGPSELPYSNIIEYLVAESSHRDLAC